MNGYYNAMEETFEEIQLFGKPVLFTPIRINNSTLPKGLYKYEVRDECGEICQIAKRIVINHWGTIISNKKIPLDSDDYRDIDENKDVNFFGECNDIESYLKKYPIKNKQNER